MKVIDLLNKIANNEISAYDKFKYENKIVNMEYLIDNCLFFSILNDEVEVLEEETLEEEKKIPEKIDISNFPKHNNSLKKTAIKLNQVIDYLKSKGE